MTDYQKQGSDFLESAGITFSVVLVGSDCPTFCEDARKGIDMNLVGTFPRKSHIHGKHYRVTLARGSRICPQCSQKTTKVICEHCTQSDKLRGEKPGKPFVIDFWNSYADEEFNALGCSNYRKGLDSCKYGREKRIPQDRPERGLVLLPARAKTPTPYDVLACLVKNDPGTFEDFCGEFGYDEDSKRADSCYHGVCKEWRNVREFFTPAEIETLQEIN